MSGVYWSERQAAENFVAGVKLGESKWCDVSGYEGMYGEASGFVYFIGVGAPYITHVKIGYTAGDPLKRMASLQTGCPFKMAMLGYVFGNVGHERELHEVFLTWRAEGEWFEYSDYVAREIDRQLSVLAG